MRYLRQSLGLTALGDPIFDDVCENIARVHALFGRAVGNRLQECSVYSLFEGFTALEMSNRYFMPKKEASSAVILELTSDIDPLGNLAQAGGNTYVYTEDNQVYYFERQQGKKDTEHKFVYLIPFNLSALICTLDLWQFHLFSSRLEILSRYRCPLRFFPFARESSSHL